MQWLLYTLCMCIYMNKICNVCLSNICVNRVISYRIMGVGCNISFPLLEDTNVEVSKANFVVNFSGVIRMYPRRPFYIRRVSRPCATYTVSVRAYKGPSASHCLLDQRKSEAEDGYTA